MSNMRIVSDSVVTNAALTSTPINSTTDNLKLNSRSKIMRFSTDQTIDIDVVPSKAISAVVFGRHTFATGTTIRIKMYSDLSQIFLVHDSGDMVISESDSGKDYINWGDFLWGAITWGESDETDEFKPDPNYVYWVPSTRDEPAPLEAYAGWCGLSNCDGSLPDPAPSTIEAFGAVNAIQSINIEITQIAQSTDIGRLIIGNYIEPNYNLSFNHSLEWIEPTKQYRTEGGTLRSDIGIPVRKINFNLNTIDAEDRTTLSQTMRTVGKRRDFYLSLFPEDTDLDKKKEYSGIVKLTKTPSMIEHAPLYYKSKYEMEEV